VSHVRSPHLFRYLSCVCAGALEGVPVSKSPYAQQCLHVYCHCSFTLYLLIHII
jgi:hypothetical protein